MNHPDTDSHPSPDPQPRPANARTQTRPDFSMLVCPQTRGPLELREDGLYSPGAGLLYPFVDGVPDFVIKTAEGNDAADHYTEHYRIDAEVFDYFEEPRGVSAHEERRLHETIIRSVPASAATILDVGCGRGWVAARFIPQNRRVFSLDITPKNPALAHRRVPSPDHVPVAADAYALPFADASLDCVISSEVIEHVVDPAGFVAGLFRVLKPGGRLIITTPYKEKIRYSLCIHCNRKTPVHAHLHSFDEHRLRELLPGNGAGTGVDMGSGVGAGAGAGAGTGAGAGAEVGSGPGAGADMGSVAGADMGVIAGTGAGAGAEVGSGPGAGADMGSVAGAGVGTSAIAGKGTSKGRHTFHYKAFANNGLIHFYTHVLLQFFPYRLWAFTDAMANRVAGKPLRILAEYTKGK